MEGIVSLFLGLLTVAFVIYPFLRRKQINLQARGAKISAQGENSFDDDFADRSPNSAQNEENLCPRCGTINQTDARFCRQCAADLRPGEKGGKNIRR